MIKNYEIDQYGVIHQIERKPFTYDKQYIDAGYGNLRRLTDEMAYLRWGYICGVLGETPDRLLDVGYGTGDFLKVAQRQGVECYGNDLFTDLLPEGCKFVSDVTSVEVDLITFFDSLEHHPNIDFVWDLKCKNIVISVPWCHNHSDEWFENWKHRKPDEHLHHFNADSLIKFMRSCGFSILDYSNIEDTIRKDPNNDQNILTAVFQKR